MELPVESGDAMNDLLPEGFRPRTGSIEAWNAAYARVEDYLRAHRIHSRLHQSRLIQAILEHAAKRHERNPSLDPTTLAAVETEAWMDRWFGAVFAGCDVPGERLAATGRVALLLTNGATKWPYSFLDTGKIPEEFARAMRESSITAGPNMAVSSMVPRPIDLGVITGAAGETLERMERWPVLKTCALWIFFAAVFAGIFLFTR
ncbi:hypothetical protein M2447_000156 [Ereboglobus sp. PH5-10]|uniref:hypothetical protein n=1 Tax=Ereboglobus sp. PH5-10 TaxID=2940629 RepID=UPI0024063426|nr:hypothetical protein [Ereboglobus sp. PH5-10]MDF9826080.1 hypothetical protein [Ereboglobus sp. PH5-10]